MRHSKKKENPEAFDNSLLGYTEPGAEDVVSATECTGLIMAPPEDEAQAKAYADLYPIPKPENSIPNGLQSQKKTPQK